MHQGLVGVADPRGVQTDLRVVGQFPCPPRAHPAPGQNPPRRDDCPHPCSSPSREAQTSEEDGGQDGGSLEPCQAQALGMAADLGDTF